MLATWYELYLAAITIDAMCVRRGFSGLVSRLGESCQMTRPMKMIGADPFPGSGDSLVVTIGGRDIPPDVPPDMAATS